MTEKLEFYGFPKVPRLRRPIVVTEKLDGTNAAVVIRDLADSLFIPHVDEQVVDIGVGLYGVRAQSRKRIITPQDDNYGFARWVWDHAEDLFYLLGEGIHFGEWWGKGIQRGYDMDTKAFSLFNTARWLDEQPICERFEDETIINTVPVLGRYEVFNTSDIEVHVSLLEAFGSVAANGYDRPEGVVIYHKAANSLFKRLIENDDIPKGIEYALTVP